MGIVATKHIHQNEDSDTDIIFVVQSNEWQQVLGLGKIPPLISVAVHTQITESDSWEKSLQIQGKSS